MLTLKAPIELKSARPMTEDHEALYHKMTANYSLMGLSVTPEDLLYAISTPPEIYYAEGDMTTITGNTVLQNRREEKIEIINNLVNRILVSASVPLTYQDRTYITDVLQRLGIRDEKLFMNEVRRFMQETSDTFAVINEYLTSPENFLYNMREFVTQQEEGTVTQTERSMENTRTQLAAVVMKRLQTGAIYQIVSNFNRSVTDQNIDAGQLMVSEQSYTAQQILLGRIREEVFREGPELVYRSENIYEEEFTEAGEGQQKVVNEISSAVLLDLVRNLFHAEYDRILAGTTNWYELKDVLYRSSSNTIRRLQNISSDQYNVTFTEGGEGQGLIYRKGTEGTGEALPEDEGKGALRTTEERLRREETNITQSRELLERLTREETENVRQRTENIQETLTELTKEENIKEETEAVSRAEEEFRRELNEIDRYNRESVTRYQRMMELIGRMQERRKGTGDGAAKTKKASLEALKGSAAVLERLRGEEEEGDRVQRELFHEVAQLFPDNSAQIMELIAQYMEGGALPADGSGPAILPADVTTLMNDIRETERRNETRELVLTEREDQAEEVKEELRRLEENTARENQARTGESEPEGIGLIHRRNESLSAEELEETISSLRQSMDRTNREEIRQESIEERREVTHRTVTQQKAVLDEDTRMNIADMVNDGVRRQVGAISEEVLRKLEKRLRNEKSRRGI